MMKKKELYYQEDVKKAELDSLSKQVIANIKEHIVTKKLALENELTQLKSTSDAKKKEIDSLTNVAQKWGKRNNQLKKDIADMQNQKKEYDKISEFNAVVKSFDDMERNRTYHLNGFYRLAKDNALKLTYEAMTKKYTIVKEIMKIGSEIAVVTFTDGKKGTFFTKGKDVCTFTNDKLGSFELVFKGNAYGSSAIQNSNYNYKALKDITLILETEKWID